MNPFEDLLQFLDRLDAAKIHFHLRRIREAVMVEVNVPGEKWEIEFFADGEIDVERFVSQGGVVSARWPENEDILDHLVVLWGYDPAEENMSHEENVVRQNRAVYGSLHDEILAIVLRHDPMEFGRTGDAGTREPPKNYVHVVAMLLVRLRFDGSFEEARLDLYRALSSWKRRGWDLGPIDHYNDLARDIWDAWTRWKAQHSMRAVPGE